MRILYGVVGEGMGHAMRSRVVIDDLLARGHEVQVVVSGRAYDYLKQRAGERLMVDRVWGYTLVYEDNEVSAFKTAVANLKGAVTGWPHNIRTYVEITERFEPQVVISDFESWSYLFAQRHGLPVISVDNMQIINRCQHPPEVLAGMAGDFELCRAIVKTKVPGAFHYHVTTFFYPPARKEHTTLHPPILRPEILAARPQRGDHLLVYQTSTSNAALPEVLRRTGRECRIYGLRRELRQEVLDGNLRYRPFAEESFIEDLRTARGVVASAGFTLMGEAVYLRRPLLAVPVRKQFEQILNARYLEREGYGMAADLLDDRRVGEFLERIPDCESRLGSYRQDGNRDLLEALAGTLAAAASASGGAGGK